MGISIPPDSTGLAIQLTRLVNTPFIKDTLERLLGSTPKYFPIHDEAKRKYLAIGTTPEDTAHLAGEAFPNGRVGQFKEPGIGIPPFTLKNRFSSPDPGHSGYDFDSTKNYGENVLGHEFGHLMQDKLATGKKAEGNDLWSKYSEGFAQNFNLAVQFLRHGSVDPTELNSEAFDIMEELLKRPLFKNHPLNTTPEQRIVASGTTKDGKKVKLTQKGFDRLLGVNK